MAKTRSVWYETPEDGKKITTAETYRVPDDCPCKTCDADMCFNPFVCKTFMKWCIPTHDASEDSE